MSLAILEKKWKYLEKKEKIVRDTFDPRKDRFQGFSVPVVIKDRLHNIKNQEQTHGYDPYKACSDLSSLLRSQR